MDQALHKDLDLEGRIHVRSSTVNGLVRANLAPLFEQGISVKAWAKRRPQGIVCFNCHAAFAD
jgi:hypothetical protein